MEIEPGMKNNGNDHTYLKMVMQVSGEPVKETPKSWAKH